MKLFYKPGACSLASHIVLHEIGKAFEIEAVDTSEGKTAGGADFLAINPKGYVPALQMDDGGVLTEGPAILQFLSDTAPQAGLAPEAGNLSRAKVLEHLTYVASELHKSFGPLFRSASTDEQKDAARDLVGKKFDHIESLLSDGRDFLVDGAFSIADAHLFTISNWANFTGIDLANWPNLAAYVNRIAARPGTQAAMRAEGLIQ
ncbi:glutathione transferase GstA [Rhodovulum sp. FJ3]|uniref:glutathione transferase GstA n=1 Tax=Rhodovulum sp. FJ3 TaxID=3079053 RepID=UPI00293DF27D|nr:glutathione transferase GstA [Rhodovulum sp. FJ3]MDV4169396.1 glutathione transferase GstA [Rhodovulum sp. FJ3]